MNGRGRILTGSTEVTLIRPVPAPQFRVTTVGNFMGMQRRTEKPGKKREWRLWRRTDGGYVKIFGSCARGFEDTDT